MLVGDCIEALARVVVFVPYMAMMVVQMLGRFVELPCPFVVLIIRWEPQSEWIRECHLREL